VSETGGKATGKETEGRKKDGDGGGGEEVRQGQSARERVGGKQTHLHGEEAETLTERGEPVDLFDERQ